MICPCKSSPVKEHQNARPQEERHRLKIPATVGENRPPSERPDDSVLRKTGNRKGTEMAIRTLWQICSAKFIEL